MTIGREKSIHTWLHGHTTNDEIKFLRGLPLDRLRAYYAAAPQREDWDGMDKDAVLAAAGDRIAELETRRVESERKPGRPAR
jgi:hypothetical protein